jgi:TrmH family RNA methyltransferase
MAESILSGIVVVLFEPQDPINIGAVVRAMKNMGLSRLRLVNPVHYEKNRIEQVAHGTRDIADAIEHFDSLEAALADCVRVAGFTARRRAAKYAVVEPRNAAPSLLEFAEQGPVALLFGREDRGLANEQLDLANVIVTIPTTEHASLNLAQAVLIASYELHLAADDATRRLAPPRRKAPAATIEQLERFFAQADQTLEAIDFYKSRNNEHVMRNVRSLVGRAAPDGREIELLRAMFIEVLRTMDRIRGIFKVQPRRAELRRERHPNLHDSSRRDAPTPHERIEGGEEA